MAKHAVTLLECQVKDHLKGGILTFVGKEDCEFSSLASKTNMGAESVLGNYGKILDRQNMLHEHIESKMLFIQNNTMKWLEKVNIEKVFSEAKSGIKMFCERLVILNITI